MEHSRFHALDAMRGSAALAVLIFHAGFISKSEMMPHAYLAVDFFFLLSGFVLGRAYEGRLKHNLSAARFLEMRLIRLYPLFLMGLLLGGMRACWQILDGSHFSYNPFGVGIAFAANLLMLPASNSSTSLFPFDFPAWSLFFEFLINAAFALVIWRLRSLWLLILCASAGFLLFLSLLEAGNADLGAGWSTIGGGALRVAFSFPLGVLLARIFRRRPVPQYGALLPILALPLFLAMPAIGADIFYDLAGIFVFFPLLLWICAHWEVPKQFEAACATLGDASYPLYVLHYPLLQVLINIFVRRLGFEPISASLIFAALLFGSCWLVARHIDTPIRRWLSRRTHLRAMAVQPAI